MNFLNHLQGDFLNDLDLVSTLNLINSPYKSNPSTNFMPNSFVNFSDWLFKKNEPKMNNLDYFGNILGMGGALYGAYNQQKMAKKNFDLQKDAYNFNKYLAQEELRRRKNMENNLQKVWSS